jgi:hypothetical protein
MTQKKIAKNFVGVRQQQRRFREALRHIDRLPQPEDATVDLVVVNTKKQVSDSIQFGI